MNGALGHLCAHIGWRMNEMTLPSRHRIRNSSPGGLRPSTLPLGHWRSPQNIFFTSKRGVECREARVVFKPAISYPVFFSFYVYLIYFIILILRIFYK